MSTKAATGHEPIAGSLNTSSIEQSAEPDFNRASMNQHIDDKSQNQQNHQENLLSRLVSFDQKAYYLDVRENSRGKYLKLTESSARRRSTILLSSSVISALQEVLDDAIKENYTTDVKPDELDNHWVTLFSRRVMSMQKKIYIDLMQNKRGRSLNIAELSSNRPKTSVVVSERGWFQLRRALEQIQEQFPELAAKAASAQNPLTTKVSSSNPNGAQQDKAVASRKLVAQSKRFFCDLLQSGVIKISELRKTKRESVFLPPDGVIITIQLLRNFISGNWDENPDGVENEDVPDAGAEPEQHITLVRKSVVVGHDAGQKTLKYDIRENNYGRFLRLTEIRDNKSSCVFIPSICFDELSVILTELKAEDDEAAKAVSSEQA